MKIKDIEIRMCRHNEPVMKDSEMRDGKKSDLEFLVITFHTDEGLSSSTFGFAGRGAEMAGEIANSIFKPFFIGRDPLYREQHWHEYRTADRWWNHAPILVTGHLILIAGFYHQCRQVNHYTNIWELIGIRYQFMEALLF